MTLTDPLLLVVHGPPGSGKSTLARALARELHFSVFEKDVFKDLAFETFGASDREWSKRVGALSIELLYLCAVQLLTSKISAPGPEHSAWLTRCSRSTRRPRSHPRRRLPRGPGSSPESVPHATLCAMRELAFT